MYEADGFDMVNLLGLAAPEMDRARQRHAGEYVSGAFLNTFFVGFDVTRPPFDDPRVRRAFAMAIDRERLADAVVGGYVFPATGGFVPPGMPGHSPGIGLPHDPERARQLLAEAGYPGGRGFPVVVFLALPAGREVNEYRQAQWRENLGIKVTWETMDYGIYLDRLAKESPHMFHTGWVADYPDPDNFLRVCVQRRTRWRNEAYERLVEEARRIMDQGERMRLYQQADRILVEEAPIMPLTYARRHLLVKPWVRRYSTSAIKAWFWKDVIIEPH